MVELGSDGICLADGEKEERRVEWVGEGEGERRVVVVVEEVKEVKGEAAQKGQCQCDKIPE